MPEGREPIETQAHVFVTRRIPEPGLEILRSSGAQITVGQDDEEKGVSRRELLAGARSCQVLVSLLTESIDREVLAANESLLGVAQMAVGYNNIDIEAATELGIPVANTPGVLTETTADLTWALLMAIARRIPAAHEYMAAGRYRIWGPNLFLGADVGTGASGRRKTLGVIGYGRIGRAVARRSKGFGMEVLAYSPRRRQKANEADLTVTWAELDELLAKSDFVTLHPPLTPETHHLIGDAELRLMKSSAYLINTARGQIVDERALVRALTRGSIAGAALDVYEDEPRMAPGLAECPNVVLVPHIASASIETRGRMATMAAENALACLRRRPAPNAVNPEVYDSAAYRQRMKS